MLDLQTAREQERIVFQRRSTATPGAECVVCLRALRDTSVLVCPCSHVFHVKCLRRWQSRRNNCPTCRRKFRRSSRGSSHVDSSHVDSSHVGSSHVGSSHVGSSHVGSVVLDPALLDQALLDSALLDSALLDSGLDLELTDVLGGALLQALSEDAPQPVDAALPPDSAARLALRTSDELDELTLDELLREAPLHPPLVPSPRAAPTLHSPGASTDSTQSDRTATTHDTDED